MSETYLAVALLQDKAEKPETSNSLQEYGVVVGSLLLIPRGIRGAQVKEKLCERGLHAVVVHPYFPVEEAENLQNLVLLRLREHAEKMLKELDACKILDRADCERWVEEVKLDKEILSSYWSEDISDAVKKVNDLIDVVISRLIDLSKPQIMEVVKIEN